MKYLLISGLLMVCLAAGSSQTVEPSTHNEISDTLATEITSRADAMAIRAARQVDSIMITKRVYNTKCYDARDTTTWWKYVTWQYNTIK